MTMFVSCAELAEDEELMEPPELLVPPIGIAGRVVLMTLPPKGGKSTTAAGLLAEGSRRGVRGGLITLDESRADSLQRLARCGGVMERLMMADYFDPEELVAEVGIHGLQFLVLDHLGKLAELNADFGAGSQGDPVLWGRLVAPFATLARDTGLAVILLDQARKSDGAYGGSVAKAGSVDVLAELRADDDGLVCVPRGRVPVAPFRVTLDEEDRPVFGKATDPAPARPSAVSERHQKVVLAALARAEGQEGLTATQWQEVVHQSAGLGRTAFFGLKSALYDAEFVHCERKRYRVSPAGTEWLANGTKPGVRRTEAGPSAGTGFGLPGPSGPPAGAGWSVRSEWSGSEPTGPRPVPPLAPELAALFARLVRYRRREAWRVALAWAEDPAEGETRLRDLLALEAPSHAHQRGGSSREEGASGSEAGSAESRAREKPSPHSSPTWGAAAREAGATRSAPRRDAPDRETPVLPLLPPRGAPNATDPTSAPRKRL